MSCWIKGDHDSFGEATILQIVFGYCPVLLALIFVNVFGYIIVQTIPLLVLAFLVRALMPPSCHSMPLQFCSSAPVLSSSSVLALLVLVLVLSCSCSCSSLLLPLSLSRAFILSSHFSFQFIAWPSSRMNGLRCGWPFSRPGSVQAVISLSVQLRHVQAGLSAGSRRSADSRTAASSSSPGSGSTLTSSSGMPARLRLRTG